MSHETVPTVKIKSTHKESQGEFIEINKADFDAEKHELYKEANGKKDDNQPDANANNANDAGNADDQGKPAGKKTAAESKKKK